MSGFLSAIASPSWWISVVVVGIALNLISAYAKSALDRWMAGYSTARKLRFEKDEKERSARIEKMKLSDRALFLAARREHGWWLWAILLYSLSAVILLTGNVIKFLPIVAIVNLLAIILMLLGIHAMRRAITTGSEIDDATREG